MISRIDRFSWRHLRSALLFILGLGLVLPPAASSQSPFSPSERKGPSLMGKTQTANQPPQVRPAGLEESVDPGSFRLSPGDRLAVSIWGPVDLTLDLIVTADGSLLVPSIGCLPVAGLTLTEAAGALRAQAAGVYPHSEIGLSLVEPGLLRIPATGQVVQPGSYEILSTSRLADLIDLAGGLLEGAGARSIEVRNADGSVAVCDVLAWKTDGDAAGNPHLRSGDRVHVPPAGQVYIVRGVDAQPGDEDRPATSTLLDRPFASESRRIPHRTGDDVAFALRAAGWPGKDFCDRGVWLERSGAGRIWVPLEECSGRPVEPGDVIAVPFCHEWVSVSGFVMRPGYYPFLPGGTAADYVSLAGGPSLQGRSTGWKRIDDEGASRDLGCSDTLQVGARVWVPQRRAHKISELLAPLGTAVALIVSLVAISR